MERKYLNNNGKMQVGRMQNENEKGVYDLRNLSAPLNLRILNFDFLNFEFDFLLRKNIPPLTSIHC